jgi:hypothetical protein
MSPATYFRSASHGTIWIRAMFACTALFAVLAARNVPVHFPQASCAHSAVSADSHRDQRPRFNNSGLKWSPPAGSFRLAPPTAQSVHLTSPLRSLSTLQTEGFHFNRPPPIG